MRESLNLFCVRTLGHHRLKDSSKVIQDFSALVGNLTSNTLGAKLPHRSAQGPVGQSVSGLIFIYGIF